MNYHFLLLFLTLLTSHLSTQFLVEANVGGFSVEVFHEDSIVSPFYNPSATPEELAVNAAIGSAARAAHFASAFQFNGSKFAAPLPRVGNGYYLKVSIGNPPVEALGHIDTGSDLVWVQCEPCKKCQKQNLPYFNPAKSSTNKNLPCSSNFCTALSDHKCGIAKECLYSYGYASKETTNGVVSSDTLTFRTTTNNDVTLPNTVFGCGNDNNMKFHGTETGIFGFSTGELSLVSQLGNTIKNKFAYCLLPKTSKATSKMKFADDAVLSGPGVLSTALITKKPLTFYIINLEAITIGNERLVYDQPTPGGPGNMVSDSGSTINHLQDKYYPKVEAAVKKAIHLNPVNPPSGLKLCYDKVALSKLPELNVVYHFTGADIKLKRENSFYDVNKLSCFNAVPGPINIYGSTAQLNFAVSHDLGTNKLSFAPTDCTNF